VLSATARRGIGSTTVEDSRTWDKSIAVSEEGLGWADEHGVVGPVVDFLRMNLIDDLVFAGRWDDAERHIDELRFRPDGGAAAAHIALVVGRFRVDQGRLDEARVHLRTGQETVGRGVIDPQFVTPIAEVEAYLALWEGRPKVAREVADRVTALQDRHQWMDLIRPPAAWAEADIASRARAREDHAEVQEAVRRLDRILKALHDALADEDDASTMWSERLRGLLGQVEAERSRASGAADPVAWRRAAAWLDEFGHAGIAVYARWRLAEALLERDDRDEAAEMLRVAHRRTIELGAGAVRQQLEALARRARVNLAGVDTVGDGEFGLTPREREVLELVASGLTNRVIGERLFIAEKTASVHVSNILAKLEVPNRGEAAAVAHRLGLDTSA
jgi:ATP/maltotriose-dependent transcriptional regulator MalT